MFTILLINKFGQPVTHIFALLPPVKVDEGEGEGYVERRQLGGAAAPLARLEGDHEVDVAGGTLRPERAHQLGAEHVVQELLEALVDGCRKKNFESVDHSRNIYDYDFLGFFDPSLFIGWKQCCETYLSNRTAPRSP